MHLPTVFATIVAAAAPLTSAYTITLYRDANYAGTVRSYNTAGTKVLGFEANSWRWVSPAADGCCVRFCYKNKSVGHRCGADQNPRSSSPIDKVVLGCGSAVSTC